MRTSMGFKERTSNYHPGFGNATLDDLDSQPSPVMISASRAEPIIQDNGLELPDQLLVVRAMAMIEEDPLLTVQDFFLLAKIHHLPMLERIGRYLLPNGGRCHKPRFDIFERNGYVVFKNSLTGNWHIRTKKGDLIFLPYYGE